MSNFALIMTNIRNIRIEEFNYPLPDERIARHPLDDRAACKLLVRNADGAISEHVFSEIPALLPADSMLVYNNTRVINARLRFRKGADPLRAQQSRFSVLSPHEPADYAVSFAATERCSWKCFVGNSKRWKEGVLTMPLTVGGHSLLLSARRADKDGNASIVEFSWDCPEVTFSQIIAAAGEIPIPPYLNRATESSDSADYQTVYSHIDGSVAAPTAGLHFTDEILEEISGRGIPRRELTLHVGAGTFQPVKSDEIGQHEMHSEFIAVPVKLIEELAATERRIVAVGTTSVRTLESLYHIGVLMAEGRWTGELPQWTPYEPANGDMAASEALRAVVAYLDKTGDSTLLAHTRIIIAPSYRYRIVGSMVTNFHQPRSTLLLLVSAFTGGDWRPIYDFALQHDYRFLSYGDGSLLLK